MDEFERVQGRPLPTFEEFQAWFGDGEWTASNAQEDQRLAACHCS
jgi:hypothetical protein